MGDFGFGGTLLAAELLNPTEEDLIEGGFHVEKFDAHADARLENPNNSQCFDNLIFARQSRANAGAHPERLAGTNKRSGDGEVGGYSAGGRAGFKIEQYGVSGKRITNGIAPVAHCDGAPRAGG